MVVRKQLKPANNLPSYYSGKDNEKQQGNDDFNSNNRKQSNVAAPGAVFLLCFIKWPGNHSMRAKSI